MANWILNLCISFTLLGIVEAVVKPAATYWVRKNIIKWAPLVFSYVDSIFPFLILHKNSEDLEKLVRAKFSELTGEDWSKVNLDYFWELYDPRITLRNLNDTNDLI